MEHKRGLFNNKRNWSSEQWRVNDFFGSELQKHL